MMAEQNINCIFATKQFKTKTMSTPNYYEPTVNFDSKGQLFTTFWSESNCIRVGEITTVMPEGLNLADLDGYQTGDLGVVLIMEDVPSCTDSGSVEITKTLDYMQSVPGQSLFIIVYLAAAGNPPPKSRYRRVSQVNPA